MNMLEWDASTLVVNLSGRLDGSSTPPIEASILEVLSNPPNAILLDLCELTYVASVGLRLILLIAKRLKQAGGKLVISGLQPGVAEVFVISGFQAMIPTFDTRNSALASIRA